MVSSEWWPLSLQLTPCDSLFTLLKWLYPKAIINPIIAPKPAVSNGLQVSPQVLPILTETRLNP